MNGINVGRPPLRCAASLKTRSGLTSIPFFSFGNIIAIKATDFEIRTVSKSEQRTAVGCGQLVTERRGRSRATFHGPRSNSAPGAGAVYLLVSKRR